MSVVPAAILINMLSVYAWTAMLVHHHGIAAISAALALALARNVFLLVTLPRLAHELRNNR